MLTDNTMMVIYIGTGLAIIAIIAFISALFWIYRILCCDKNSDNNSTVTKGIEMAQGLIEFSVEEIKKATKNFHESYRIGLGCLGPVYLGSTRRMLVVVKKLSGFPHPEFLAEVSYISKIRHSNVVKLVGYCCKDGYQMLVYEHLYKGSLRAHLRVLTFKMRVSIAVGAAKGLQHLHSLTPPLQHKRFDMDKVLIDAEFNPKISDAGLSRVLQERDIHLLDPNGGSEDTVDVFSFGLFLLELLTGEKPKVFKSNHDIAQSLGHQLHGVTVFDERMTGSFRRGSYKTYMKLTLKCLYYPATNRPKMDEILAVLESIHRNEVFAENPMITLGSDLFTITVA